MRHSWIDLVGSVLRPARPLLERCLRERELQRAVRRPAAERRAQAIVACEARIERERATVLAAKDGVISLRMRELEREWLALSRPDHEAEVMELWGRIAPVAWIDRKPWREGDPASSVDTAIALAADVDGVEAAEAAVASLRAALSAWGTPIAPRILWQRVEGDPERIVALLAEPLRAARAALSAYDAEPDVLEHARQLEVAVDEAMRARLPRRPSLAREVAHAAFVDAVWSAAAPADRPNPVTPLRALWRTGYALAAVGASGVTLEIPPL